MQHDGRPHRRPHLPQARGRDRRAGARRSTACRHPTEFDDIGFDLRKGEILGFYGLVGAGRSEVMQALFGITRPSPRHDHARRQDASRRSPPPTRSTPASSTCRRSAASRAWSSACRSSRTSRCPRSSAPRVTASCGSAEEFALARDYTERLDLRAASLEPGRRHAVGRQPAEGRDRQVAGDRSPRSSSSTSRPRASTSAPRPPCTASWPSSSAQGLRSSWCRPNCPRSSACPTASSSCARAASSAVFDNKGLDAGDAGPRRRRHRGGSRHEAALAQDTAKSGCSPRSSLLIGADLDCASRPSPRPANLASVFNDTSILIILALGQMAVILTRSIDLSMAANLALHRHGRGACSTPPIPAIPIPLLIVARARCSALALGAHQRPPGLEARHPARSS